MKHKMDYEKFVYMANLKHGKDRYDYSNSVYIGYTDKLNIKCNICGTIFPQTPNSHLCGHGCPVCALKTISVSKIGKTRNDMKKVLFGCAFCDSKTSIRKKKSYQVWRDVLDRCFNVAFQEKEPTYKGCSICNEWLVFSAFEEWFNNHYVEGFEIDKDLLSGVGCKLYSPETCVFLPMEINRFLGGKSTKIREGLPLGVFISGKRFVAQHGRTYLGTFGTIEEARNAYLKAKKEYITKLANKWKDKIEQRAYDALINLDVEKFFNNK
jgi:hypothetical protein